MKNKKLFAILTLVCFMMTLMPVAAFAASKNVMVGDDANPVTYDDTAVIAAGQTLDFGVYDSATTTTAATGYEFFIVSGNELVKLVTGAPQHQFNTPGTYKVYAVAGTLVTTLDGEAKMTKADKLVLLMESDNLVDEYAVVKVKDSSIAYKITLTAGNSATSADFTTNVNSDPNHYSIEIDANGGWSEDGVFEATLQKTTDGTNYSAVKGAELTFVKAGFVDLAVSDAVTDRGGDVEFEVTSERVGTYTMYVKYANEASVRLDVIVENANIANVAVETAPKNPVNVGTTITNAGVEFKFTDNNGVAYVTTPGSALLKLDVVSQPADSDLEASDLSLSLAPTGSGIWKLSGAATLDEEGIYVFRATLKNGKSAEATVKVAEAGDTVAIKFTDKVPTTALYSDATATPANVTNLLGLAGAVVAVDAKGVATPLTHAQVTFSVTGKAFTSFTEGTASVNMKDDEKYVGSTITLYAVYGNFTTSHTITVTDNAETLKYAATTGNVGETNTFAATLVDAAGKRVVLDGWNTASTAIVLEKPENAVVVATVEANAKGGVNLNLLASVAGEYKIQTVVIDGANKYITSIDTFTLGAVEGTFNDVIVLSIGSNNMIKNGSVNSLLAAPEIKDGRTMIPMRAGLEAFGATVNWNEANRTVTAEMNGTTVVMTVDSLDYTVNGKAMKADSAPYIKNGSTMVPAVFFTNAFGIVATPLYDANGVCDVLFSK